MTIQRINWLKIFHFHKEIIYYAQEEVLQLLIDRVSKQLTSMKYLLNKLICNPVNRFRNIKFNDRAHVSYMLWKVLLELESAFNTQKLLTGVKS